MLWTSSIMTLSQFKSSPIANMRELRRFVRNHGSEHNLPSMKVINSVLRSHTGLVRLYFDAVYQERKYGSKIDEETDEIL